MILSKNIEMSHRCDIFGRGKLYDRAYLVEAIILHHLVTHDKDLLRTAKRIPGHVVTSTRSMISRRYLVGTKFTRTIAEQNIGIAEHPVELDFRRFAPQAS